MKTVLIIEDDAALRDNIAEFLELADYKTFSASNGKNGINMALRQPPDLIICDIMMPEADGYEVLETLSLKEETKNVPFIFLSAKTEHKEVRKGMNMGADDYLTKPFEEEDLLEAVKSRLAKSELIAASRQADKPEGVDEDTPHNLNQLKNFFWDEGKTATFAKQDNVYKKGEHSNTIYLVLKGLVKTHTLDSSGKDFITGLYKPDDFLGLTTFENTVPHKETATCLETTELVELPKTYLQKLLQGDQNVSMEFMNLLNENLADIKKQLIRMAYHSVRKKTATSLIQFSDLTGNKKDKSIRISRGDLAAKAGIAPESLIRTLSEFRKKGLINVKGRTIHIIDPEGLQAIK